MKRPLTDQKLDRYNEDSDSYKTTDQFKTIASSQQKTSDYSSVQRSTKIIDKVKKSFQ